MEFFRESFPNTEEEEQEEEQQQDNKYQDPFYDDLREHITFEPLDEEVQVEVSDLFLPLAMLFTMFFLLSDLQHN